MSQFDDKNKQMDILGIRKILPHRYPFALLDKILDWDVENKSIVAQKNVTINEDFFLMDTSQISQLCLEFCLLKLWPKLQLYWVK